MGFGFWGMGDDGFHGVRGSVEDGAASCCGWSGFDALGVGPMERKEIELW